MPAPCKFWKKTGKIASFQTGFPGSAFFPARLRRKPSPHLYAAEVLIFTCFLYILFETLSSIHYIRSREKRFCRPNPPVYAEREDFYFFFQGGLVVVERANILIEALPYIRRFYQKTVVIKYGGHAMVAEDLKESFAKDIVLMKYIGINPVVVHGGGPQIGNMLRRIGKKTDFYEGMRITDADTMDIVEMVLAGKVNKEIVALINRQGGLAIGLSGKDAHLIEARKLQIFRDMGEDQPPEIMDIGHVGEVSRVNLDILEDTGAKQHYPGDCAGWCGRGRGDLQHQCGPGCGSDIGRAQGRQTPAYDGCIRRARQGWESDIQHDHPEAEAAMRNETLRGGMIPKIQCAVDALEAGAEKVHIVDGRLPHAILLEMFTDAGIGTEILRSRGQEK